MGRGKLCLPGYGEPGAARNLCPPEEVLTMRVVVDFELCESNAVCADILPEVFEVRSDNFLYLVNEHPTEDLPRQGYGSRGIVPETGNLGRRGLNAVAHAPDSLS